MPEFVYALHDFAPENEDELSFKAGERIEVIEKDDLYQDGWWQVSLSSVSTPEVYRARCRFRSKDAFEAED
jgi:hypothetical protein